MRKRHRDRAESTTRRDQSLGDTGDLTVANLEHSDFGGGPFNASGFTHDLPNFPGWNYHVRIAKRNGIVRLADVLTGHSIRHFVSCLEPRQHPPRRLRSVRQSYPEYQTCDPEEDEPNPGQLPQQCWRSAQLRSVGQIREAQQCALGR
jgi:hypothetical protein